MCADPRGKANQRGEMFHLDSLGLAMPTDEESVPHANHTQLFPDPVCECCDAGLLVFVWVHPLKRLVASQAFPCPLVLALFVVDTLRHQFSDGEDTTIVTNGFGDAVRSVHLGLYD